MNAKLIDFVRLRAVSKLVVRINLCKAIVLETSHKSHTGRLLLEEFARLHSRNSIDRSNDKTDTPWYMKYRKMLTRPEAVFQSCFVTVDDRRTRFNPHFSELSLYTSCSTGSAFDIVRVLPPAPVVYGLALRCRMRC